MKNSWKIGLGVLFWSLGSWASADKKDLPTSQPTSLPKKDLSTSQSSQLSSKDDSGRALRKRVVEVQLSNGMLFLLVQRKNSPTFSANIRIKVGGVDEELGYTGLAHIFEHMAFKGSTVVGTKNWEQEKDLLKQLIRVGEAYSHALSASKGRKTPAIRVLKLRLEQLQRRHQQWVRKNEFMRIYDAHGGTKLNATTGKDMTSYFLNLPSNRLALWALQESSRLTAPVFREFYKERAVVVEERRMGMSKGMHRLYEQFMATAFIAHPYRFPTVGWMSDITTIPLERVKAIFKKYYVPSNMVGSIVGDFDMDKTLRLLENTFGKIPVGKAPPTVRTVEPKQEGERRVQIHFHTNPSVLIGFHKPTAPHSDDDVFDMLQGLLTSGRSSRLYKSLVKANIAQGIWASSLPGARFANVFTLGATPVAPHTTETIEKVIYKEFKKLQTTLVPQKELEKVRKNFSMSFLRGLRSNSGLANQLSYFQTILGDWKYATTMNKRMKAVTAEDIRRVARKYLTKKNRTVATLIQEKAKHSVNDRQAKRKSLREMAWFKKDLKKNPQWMVQAKKLLEKYGKEVSPVVRDLPTELRQHPNQLKIQKLNFKPLKPTVVVLPNGLKLYLVEDKELPLLDVVAVVKAGRMMDPKGKIGLGAMFGSLLRSGGIQGFSSEKLDQILAEKAIQMESGTGNDFTSATLSLHKNDLKWGLQRLLTMLRFPQFEPLKIAWKKKQMLEAYRRRFDQPFALAIHKFRPLVFGKNHRMGQFENPKSISRIHRADLLAFHRKYFHPNGTSLAIVGDFDTTKLVALLKKWTASWKKAKIVYPKDPLLPNKVEKKTVLVRRKLPQTLFLVGHLGINQHAKDRVAAKVMNHILGGGGFSSRLMQEIRTNRGLAYFAGSQLSLGKDKGLFLAYTGTQPQKTGVTLKLLWSLLHKMSIKPEITQEELDLAKKTLLNQFIFLMDSPLKVVMERMKNDWIGYPENNLDWYRKQLQGLTLLDIEKAAKKYLDPSQFVTLIVGWDADFDEPLSSFGKVEIIELGKSSAKKITTTKTTAVTKPSR